MEKIVEKYLGLKQPQITECKVGTQNTVYSVDNKYFIKIFNKDTINNEYQRNIRECKEKVAEVANQHGINVILPFKFNERYIQKEDEYFVIYPYKNYKSITKQEILTEHIESLATSVTKLHSLSIKSNLPIIPKSKFNLDLDKYINLYKNNENIKNVIIENKEKLKNLESRINSALDSLNGKQIISHNDLKLENVLWDRYDAYFVDWDATGYINHMCAANEYAYFWAVNKGELNSEYYKRFMKIYLRKHKCTDNIYDVIYATLYGKFSWLQYSLERSIYEDKKEAKKGVEAIESLIKAFSSYEKNIPEMINIINTLNK